MSVWTLIRYLMGDRAAILEIASSRHALWVGLLFVLSAGFAREYDGEDLLSEPWHLFIPLGASLVASFVLYFMLRASCEETFLDFRAYFFSDYASFLGLFWMTAPLAWLYAIPYERFCEPRLAIDLNLGTLGLVALWRMALMIRVACVCAAMRPLGATAAVMTFGSGAFGLASLFLSLPMLSIMGGLRAFDEKTNLQRAVEGGLGCHSLLLFTFCGIAAAVLTATGKKGWSVPPTQRQLPGIGLVGLACLSLLVWIPLLPRMQPEQQRRRQVEKAIDQGRYADAVEMLAHTPREAFPPCWMPPPRVVSEHFLPRSAEQVLGMLEASAQRELPEWVGEHYRRRLAWLLRRGMSFRLAERLAEALPRIPGGMDMLAEVEADPDLGEQQKRWLAEVRVLMRNREKQSHEGAKR